MFLDVGGRVALKNTGGRGVGGRWHVKGPENRSVFLPSLGVCLSRHRSRQQTDAQVYEEASHRRNRQREETRLTGRGPGQEGPENRETETDRAGHG